MRLSRRLWRAMQARELSMRKLSQRSMVAQYTIQRILRGENTSLDTLVALAGALGVSVDWLIAE